jgi:hypothetical protein
MIIGPEERFAIECVVEQIIPSASGMIPLGRVRMLAGRLAIGDYEVPVVLSVWAHRCSQFIADTRNRKNPVLFDLPAEEVLNTISENLYGREAIDGDAQDNEKRFRRYCICPNSCEAFDGELAILIEGSSSDRFLWRDYATGQVHEQSLEPGLVRNVLISFLDWLDERVRKMTSVDKP